MAQVDSQTHFFSVGAAKVIGVNAAIILQNLYYWVTKNEANGDGMHDGRYWTYNSVEAFNRLFPYLSKGQIRGALKKLEDGGYIISGNFNESKYVRTKWYALTDSGYALVQNCRCISKNHKMESSKNENQFAKTSKCSISTDNKPDNKPDIRPDDEKTSRQSEKREAAKRIVNYLNSTTGQHYRYTDSTLRLIIARLDEGYSEERLRKIINVMIDKWGSDDRMRQYLRPQTLFNATKCESYDQYLPPERTPMLAGEVFG